MKYIKKYETIDGKPKFYPDDVVYAIFTVNTSLVEDKPYVVKEISEENGDFYCTLKNDKGFNDNILSPYNQIRFISEFEYNSKKYNI